MKSKICLTYHFIKEIEKKRTCFRVQFTKNMKLMDDECHSCLLNLTYQMKFYSKETYYFPDDQLSGLLSLHFKWAYYTGY